MDVETFNNLSIDEQAKMAISSKDKKTLSMIADSNSDYAKMFVARNKSTTWDILDKLSLSKSRVVIEAVLANPYLHKSTKEKLLQA